MPEKTKNSAGGPCRLRDLEFQPLTSGRWEDFEKLFGRRGAWGGCWCMWWRLTSSEFEKQRGQGTKQAMRSIVESGEVPGTLAYSSGEPVRWCSLGPRERFPRLERSPVLGRVDDHPVWSIVCFFVHRRCRRQGLSGKLLGAALDYARSQGADIVEAYPVEPKRESYPAVSAWTGFHSTFQRMGFTEVLRRKENRPNVRYYFGRASKG